MTRQGTLESVTTVALQVAQFIAIHRPFEEDFNLFITVMDNIFTTLKAINEVEFEQDTDSQPRELTADDRDRPNQIWF